MRVGGHVAAPNSSGREELSREKAAIIVLRTSALHHGDNLRQMAAAVRSMGHKVICVAAPTAVVDGACVDRLERFDAGGGLMRGHGTGANSLVEVVRALSRDYDRMLGLPGVQPEVAIQFRDKNIMAARAQELGVRTAAGCVPYTLETLERFVDEVYVAEDGTITFGEIACRLPGGWIIAMYDHAFKLSWPYEWVRCELSEEEVVLPSTVAHPVSGALLTAGVRGRISSKPGEQIPEPVCVGCDALASVMVRGGDDKLKEAHARFLAALQVEGLDPAGAGARERNPYDAR